MGNQCGNLLQLLVFRFNITFWVQICRMRNFHDVYFHYFNFQKICVLSVFQKMAMFLAKIWFHKILQSDKFSQISLILSFFTKVYFSRIWKSSICKSLSRRFFLICLSLSIIKPLVSKKLKKVSKISWFSKVYLAKYFTLLNSQKFIQNILAFSPRESFSN